MKPCGRLDPIELRRRSIYPISLIAHCQFKARMWAETGLILLYILLLECQPTVCSGLHTYGCGVGIRTRCHYEGITKENCEIGGCCYDATGTPACYYSSRELLDECAAYAASPADRVECGYAHMPQWVCEARGCCWDNSVPGVPWCFIPADTTVTGFQQRAGGCSQAAISTHTFTLDQCRTQCLLTDTCASFGYYMATRMCKTMTVNCQDDSLDQTLEELYIFDSMAHRGYICMLGVCPLEQYETYNHNARDCVTQCSTGCLGFTMHFSNGVSVCILHHATCTQADLDTSPLNSYYCHRGPVIEGLPVPGISHLTLVDADSDTCLNVPFTPSQKNYLRIQYGWPTAQSSSTTFTVQLEGSNLLCTQRRTMAYVTSDSSSEELRRPELNSEIKQYRTCSLTSSDTTHCSFSCHCNKYCSTLFVSVLAEKANQSWQAAKLCEVTVTV